VSFDAYKHCLDVAYRYLSYRPRSEEEIKKRLKGRGFSTGVVEKIIEKLKEQDLINDLAFAEFWREGRLSNKPKSKRLIIKELSDKKVENDIIKQVTESIDDESNAYILGRNRARTLINLDWANFRRRLANYLGYRGFSYEVIKHTIDILWEEREQENSKL
jgi:regulatory protein